MGVLGGGYLSGFLHRKQLCQIWLSSTREESWQAQEQRQARCPSCQRCCSEGPQSPPRALRARPVGSVAPGWRAQGVAAGAACPWPAACMRLPGFGEQGGEARPGGGLCRACLGGRGKRKRKAVR